MMIIYKGVECLRKYRTVQGDMWDWIAYKVYGDESYLNVLLEYNQEYAHYVVLPAGIILNCPNVVFSNPTHLPPWRRQ